MRASQCFVEMTHVNFLFAGLPNRNGIHHSKNIADLALQLMIESKKIKIGHLNDENLKVRMGFNSGPVTAGVIGHKMPQ